MQTTGFEKNTAPKAARYIPLPSSIAFLFSRKRLVGLSLLLFLVTIFLTWLCYQFSLNLIDGITGGFFVSPPDTATIMGWLHHKGWLILKWVYLLITRIAAFYLAFLVAYTITTPGYVLLSTSAEKLHAGEKFEMDEGLTLRGILLDLWEGLKIAGFGIIVTIAALFTSFIPVFGLIITFLLYTYYSALMFLDYPASRRRWSLGRKIAWIMSHKGHSFRLGLLPAMVSMIPVFNIFFIALLFPVLTVHATLNFTTLELVAQNKRKPNHGR
ncbi:EI24 domain-containing protein [Desulfopila inferna]|uniref:EI24 domain-containing protein n=1 Tax=Desulfopila inferna TaxID=468528 RepID=UPI0019628B66|nr:EI24 domain-containing protein [Desulfopila inferna]MBM9603986.1 EI24 domain-containing protein [Desulfopila inferna]